MEVMFALEDISIINYSFEGNLCKFTFYEEVMYADYIANGDFPCGDYIMKEWDYDSSDNIYYNEKTVLEQNGTYKIYYRTSKNSNGSNPSEWTYDEGGTYAYTGNKAIGGSLIMKDNYVSQYSFKAKNSIRKTLGKTSSIK